MLLSLFRSRRLSEYLTEFPALELGKVIRLGYFLLSGNAGGLHLSELVPGMSSDTSGVGDTFNSEAE